MKKWSGCWVKVIWPVCEDERFIFFLPFGAAQTTKKRLRDGIQVESIFLPTILIASSHMALPDLLRGQKGNKKKKKLIKGLMCKPELSYSIVRVRQSFTSMCSVVPQWQPQNECKIKENFETQGNVATAF